MKPTWRTYSHEADYWRIRAFLRQTMLRNGLTEQSWHVARFDYWRWHGIENCRTYASLAAVVFIWEAADGEIVAVLNPEGPGEAHFQVHPDLRTPELDAEMLAVAEAHLAVTRGDGRKRLITWADDSDTSRCLLLERCGYTRGDWPDAAEQKRRQSLSAPLPAVLAPAGYTVRALGDEDELPARSWVSWRAFHPAEPASAYQGWEWYHNIQRQPLYRRDLDIVAAPRPPMITAHAPTGEIAAFCTAWYDDVTRTAYFEPVGAAPEHHRRGLGRAVMAAALHRLQQLGCAVAFVGGYSLPANALYAAAGFVAYDCSTPWQRTW